MGPTGWYIGFAVAFVIIWVVVILVAALLNLSRRISVQAREIAVALNATGTHTDPLQAISSVNQLLVSTYGVVGSLRTQLIEGRRV